MSFLFGGGSSTTTAAEKIRAFQATTCDFGTAVPLLYGTSKIGPNLIKYANFTSQEKRTTTSSGKSESTQISYNYYVDVQLALGEGPIDGVGRVWVGDDRYGSLSALGRSIEGGSNSWVVHRGNESGNSYGTLAYVEGSIFLGCNSASMPSYNFETYGQLRSTGNGIDVSPAMIIKDILERIGLGNYIDSTSFDNYKRFCTEADLLVSTPADAFTSQQDAQEVIKELLTLTNTYMFWSVDRFKFVPRESARFGDWHPNTQIAYDITHDDLICSNGVPMSFKRKDTKEQYNFITINFTNRANDYEAESVSYQDTANISANGYKKTSVDAKWFHTKERAVKYANMVARKILTETNQYQMVLDWAFCRLEPGDLIRVTEPLIGLSNKVMMVSEVTEAKNGTITVTAIERPNGEYGAALYTVHDSYNYQDFNIAPSNTAAPLFIIPPSDLVTSSNGLEIWIALHGIDSKWGGCQVYASDKDGDYSYHGEQAVSSYYGKTLTAMTANSTSVTVKFSNPNTVQLLTGEQDPSNDRTLIWINGECMSYTEATVSSGTNTWTLTGLIRGQHGTKAAAHSIGDAMACLDSGIYKLPLTKHYKGKTIYFKFPAFNVLQANLQSVNDLDCYTCVASVFDMPNCEGVTAYNKYRELADDVTRYDIVVEWTPPQGFASYKQGQVWYKTSGQQTKSISTMQAGVKVNETGLHGNWIYGGQGYNNVTLPQAVIGDTYKIAVCTENIYGDVESPDSSSQVEILVALKSETPNTPSNLGTNLTDTFNIIWDEVRNADIKYYEVRLDANVGVDNANLLVRTTEHKLSTSAIQTRTGTIYVFAVSAYNVASAPAKITYNYPKPSAPVLTCTSKLSGIECKASTMPVNCSGVHWYFDGTDTDYDLVTSGITYYYQANAGVYEISACYQDYFGDGTISGSQMVSIAAYIDETLIKSESVTLEKLSADAQKAIEEGGLDTVNIAVKGMLGEGSALVLQPDGSYALVASNGETLTGLFANQEGVMRLQGKYIHITGDTVVDGSIITNNMLAGGITADKMNVNSLSAITGTIGTLRTATSGARVEISDNQIRVYDSNNVLRVRIGVW